MRSPSEPIVTNLSSYTVLIVEASSNHQEQYRRWLLADSSCRYTILDADSVTEAVKICQSSQIDGILVDSQPHATTGLELTQELQTQLKNQYPPVVVIASDPFISAEGAVQEAVRAIKSGAEDYLIQQTLTSAQLQASMRSAIENARSRFQQAAIPDSVRAQDQALSDLVTELQTLIDIAPVGIAISTDPSCAQMRHNAYLRELLGVSPGHNISKSAPAEEQPRFRVIQNGQELPAEDLPMQIAARLGVDVRDTELEIVLPNAEVRYLLCYASPVQGPHHEIKGAIGIFLDITERKRIEAALQESHKQLINTLESITDAFYALDAAWQFTFINPQAARLLKKTQTELIGKSLWEEFPEVVGSEFDQAFRHAMVNRVAVNFEALYPALETWFEVRVYPTRSGLAIYFQDVTPRKAAEAEREQLLHQEQAARTQVEALLRQLEIEQNRLEQVLQQMPIGVAITDAPSGKIRFHNQEAIRLLGHPLYVSETYQDYIQYGAIHPDGQLYQPEDYPTARSLLTGQVVKAEELLYRRGDDIDTVFSVNAAPIFDLRGEMISVVCTFEDIAQRKQTETRLQDSEERLRLALKAAGMGIWDWDVQQDCVTWAGDNEVLFGLPPGKFAGTYEAFLACVHPDDREAVKQRVAEALRQKRGYDQEFRVLYPDGTVRWLSTQSELFLDRQGNPARLIGTNYDITNQKQAERVLQEREHQYKLLANSIHQVIWVTDGQGRFQFTNDRWYDYCGLDYLETAETWESVVHPDDREICAIQWQTARSTSQPYSVECRLRRADGEYRWHIAHGVPVFDAAGQVEQWIATITDIHDRKLAETALTESEARYRALAEMIPQFVWMAGASGQNEYVNHRFREYTGRSEAELLNLDWVEVLHPDDRESSRQRWFLAVHNGEFYTVEYRLRRFDGTYRWFLGQGQPLRDQQGKITRWFGTCTDIHDQKQIEMERAQLLAAAEAARSEAEVASRMKDEFLAIVSHELRSPLNAMLGWAKLLRGGQLNEAMREKAVEVIERNAEAQTQLIEDLLDISRIIRGQIRLNLTAVNLMQVITAAIDTMRPSTDIKQIQIESRLQSLATIVQGDIERLQQVVWNLLSNAVKFTPPGGRVEVTLAEVDNQAQIRVTDTGKGIRADFLPYVFDRFRQAENVTTRVASGLGLGLAIVRSLVELHGGTVYVESPGEGKGSTFIVQLPLFAGIQSRQDREQPVSSPDVVSLENMRVLVVDDELDTREFLIAALKIAGATVIAAASASEGRQQFQRWKPDVLISDIGMPNEDGYVFIQWVRSLTPEQGGTTPAIALTAFARQEDRMQAIAAGFQIHLAKPIEPNRLVAATKALAQDIDLEGR